MAQPLGKALTRRRTRSEQQCCHFGLLFSDEEEFAAGFVISERTELWLRNCLLHNRTDLCDREHSILPSLCSERFKQLRGKR